MQCIWMAVVLWFYLFVDFDCSESFYLLIWFILASSMDRLYAVALILYTCEDRIWEIFQLPRPFCASQAISDNMCTFTPICSFSLSYSLSLKAILRLWLAKSQGAVCVPTWASRDRGHWLEQTYSAECVHTAQVHMDTCVWFLVIVDLD